MNNNETSIKFIPINIGLITISDSRIEENDKSGNLLKERIKNYIYPLMIDVLHILSFPYI